VRGEAITEELWDTALCEKGQLDVEQCTVTAKEIVGVCPIYFFGRTRQGKSTLINNLLQELGDNTRPAKEHHMAPCTKGVHMHRQECTAWTTQSVKETVVLVDTKGWEFEGNEGDLFADCLAKAEREKIRPEVLHQRLVLVLVLGAENRHEISDSRFLGLVKRVCLQASEAAAKARGERPVLLPIVSKQDLIDTYIQKATSDGLERVLNTVVGDIMNVQAPVFATNKSSACIVELRNQLASICRKQLASTTILRAVQESTEEELLKLLESWDEKGIDAAHSLARRYVWVVARHRGLRMKSLYHKQPFLSWDTAKSLVKMLRDPNLKVQQPGKDDWHTDELRKTKLELEHPRGHGKPNPNELEHPKKLGKPESPSGESQRAGAMQGAWQAQSQRAGAPQGAWQPKSQRAGAPQRAWQAKESQRAGGYVGAWQAEPQGVWQAGGSRRAGAPQGAWQAESQRAGAPQGAWQDRALQGAAPLQGAWQAEPQ